MINTQAGEIDYREQERLTHDPDLTKTIVWTSPEDRHQILKLATLLRVGNWYELANFAVALYARAAEIKRIKEKRKYEKRK